MNDNSLTPLATPKAQESAEEAPRNVRPLSLEILSEGMVAPLTSLAWGNGGNPGTFDGGAYYPDGSVCARSLHQKAGFINRPLPLSWSPALPRVQGTHLYGGLLKNEHFGHFLAESLSRVWALSGEMEELDSIVFYPRMLHQPVPDWVTRFMEIIAPDIPITIVSETTVFEFLVVPDPAVHHANGFVYGHPLMRTALDPLRQIKGKSYEKLYVSRSGLKNSGGILGEKWLEDNLAKEGYLIFHPEKHSLKEQISFYNGAQSLIFAEGAALHLFALACRPEQKVYIVQRRRNASIFEWQLSTFGLTPIVGPESPQSYWIPEKSGRTTLFARARIDLSKLSDQLADRAFVSSGNWDLPTETLIQEEITEIQTRIGQRLVEYPANAL